MFFLITGDDIYKILLNFDKMYMAMDEAEYRHLMESLSLDNDRYIETIVGLSNKNATPKDYVGTLVDA